MGEIKLLEQIGGETGCRRLAADFYSRVAFDEELKPLFPGKSLRCVTEEFAAFLIQFLDGDPDQTQYRWWLSLRESHARFEISEVQRRAWLKHMEAAIESVVASTELRVVFCNFVELASKYIVFGEDIPFDHDELSRRWEAQLALDRLCEDIAAGRDHDAIVLAAGFAGRSSVLVGVFAKMMEAGRETLIEFVLTQLASGNSLAASRFNGRSLLHFAAGHGCLSVVRLLLEFGVDPNLLDSGGHAPLYRAAGGGNSEINGEVVRALAGAGANVNHGGGVSRSTALHEAARWGNVCVARALLELGASRDVRDKKGLTPLDRAKNCRRNEVAALLEIS